MTDYSIRYPHFSYDWLRVNETSSPYVDTFSGVCPDPCDFDTVPIPKSIISADGGQIKLNFTSDNLMHFKGFWVEYEIGIKYVIGSYFCYYIVLCEWSFILSTRLYCCYSSCHRNTWFGCMSILERG